jgi:hypothetical protein
MAHIALWASLTSHKRRILVAIYPPHSIHRLQPLDVGLFNPLATDYSQALHAHTRQSLGLLSVSKQGFFSIFYSAFDKAFSEENIQSGWRKAGIEPWDPAQVLKIYDKEAGEALDDSSASASSESLRSSCLDSPRATRRIRSIVGRSVAADRARKDKTIRLLGDVYLGASAQAELAEQCEQGLLKSINSEKKKKRKRGSAFTEQLGADKGLDVLFFSPSNIVRARELAAAQEVAKDDKSLDRSLQAQDKAQLKSHKKLEAQPKPDDRAFKAVARKTKRALGRAQRERDKLTEKAFQKLIAGRKRDIDNTRIPHKLSISEIESRMSYYRFMINGILQRLYVTQDIGDSCICLQVFESARPVK